MSTFRTVFLGTPGIASHSLQALLNDEHFDLVGVVTQPDRPAGRKLKLTPSPVKQLALANDLPVITPENINTKEVLQQLKDWNAECAVVVAFGQLMKQEFLQLYPRKVVNVHASLLPRWRGAAPIQRAMIAGDSVTGCALQVMELGLDVGDVIGIRKTEITDGMDALDLLKTMEALSAQLLTEDFLDYLRGMLAPQKQDESLATYAKKLLKPEARVEWAQPAKTIFNFIRGFKMGPGAFTEFGGKKVKLHKTRVIAGDASAEAGEVVDVSEDKLLIACGDGRVLELLQVQPESKSKMSAADFIRGFHLKRGDRFL